VGVKNSRLSFLITFGVVNMNIKPKYFFPALIIAVCGIVGVSAKFITGVDDGPIEEAAETLIENQIDDTFNLPISSEGKIDLSPSSKEH